ncbi:sulfatase [Pedobacter frigoris]|uniref:sulfatase n=1 Tax=Pedobacter frigoris TaxID=2571272 RepID=UPI00292F887D|nr:sulfatase [Pedobacter frigoris]
MNFRSYSIRTICLILLVLPAIAAAQQKRNILLIFADDMGYKDCGFTGSDKFETPNIDALAKSGMVFNNAYAGAGNCAPSRACLLSGSYTPRHGVYAVGSTTRGPLNLMRMVPVKNTTSLNPSFVTIAEALKKQGYATGIFGKWHLGNKPGLTPKDQGFDEYNDSRANNPNKNVEGTDDPKGVFSLTNATIEFMQKQQGKPFFAYLAHHAIHSAQEALPATLAKFKAKGLKNKDAMYAACVYDFDASIGLIMKYLKESGLDKNTLVVFTSDNGATQASSQEPLRGNKGSYYEGGIREPFIASWPGYIKPSTSNNTPIINLDLYPTFLALAGNKNIALDGENLLPIFYGDKENTQRKEIFWHFPGYLDNPVIRGRDSIFRTRPVTAMRKGDWKILLYHEEWLLDGGKNKITTNNAIELYNLKDDEGERKNLANINPAKRDEMLQGLLNWLKKTNAPMPVKIDATHQLEKGGSAASDD